jgi:YD repeat-containing protein
MKAKIRKQSNLVLVITLTLLINSIKIFSQNPVPLTPTVIPPAPTAGELGRYGLIPVGLSTGTINPNISLYSFNTKNLSLPISLTYNSSPIRVDEIAPWVGMHWSLDCGGVITRIVRDDPDEITYFGLPYPESFSTQNPKAMNYIQQAGQYNLDTEPDLYSFNFLGHSGKFVFDRTGSIVCMPRSDLSIQRLLVSGQGNFVITTPDGIKYTFDAAESSTMQTSYDATFPAAISAWYLTKIEHPLGDVITLTYANSSYTYLLGYSQTFARSTVRNNCNVRDNEQTYTLTCPEESSSNSTTSMFISGKHLVKIESAGYGAIEFNATTGRTDLNDFKLDGFVVRNPAGNQIKAFSLEYLFSNNTGYTNAVNSSYSDLQHRMFLNKVIERDKDGNQIKRHELEYDDINGLPARLAFAQDHWGYFNGAQNYNFLPQNLVERDYTGYLAFAGISAADREPHPSYAQKGMLKKITYPTGGSSTFSYGPNTYYGQKTIYPSLTSISLSFTHLTGTAPITITSPIDQQIQIQANSSLIPGYTSTFFGDIISITDENGNLVAGQDMTLDPSTSYAPKSYSTYVNLLANHQYTFKIIAQDGDGENNTQTNFSTGYYATAPQIVNDNIETGGMRINSVANYDPVTGKTEVINYYYARHDQLSISSGKISAPPNYVTHYFLRNACGVGLQSCNYYDCPYVALNSNNVSNVFLTSHNIGYEFVTVSRGTDTSAGVEEHEFTIRFDNPGTQIWGTDYVKDAPLTNDSWDDNQEKNVRYYTSKQGTFVLIKQINNSYVKDSRYHKEVPGLATRKKYDPRCPKDVTYDCDQSNINLYWQDYYCTANHNHWLVGLPWEDSWICIAPGHNMQWVTYMYHPCYGRNVGDIAIVPSAIDNIDALEYKNISEWVYLDKTTETNYDEDGLNPVVSETQYFYENVDYPQITRTTTTTSEAKLKESKVKYAFDYDPASNDMIGSMLNKYMVGIPIKQETTLNGNLIDGSVKNFNSKGQPTSVYKYESSLLQLPPAHNASIIIPSTDYKLKAIIEFDPLTNNENKVQLTDNFSTVYLWGYDNKLPIAEVRNADNSSILRDMSTTVTHTASVSTISYETSMWPTFEVFANQSINPSLSISTHGSNIPPGTLIYLTLRKADGTLVTKIPSTTSQTNIGSISLAPGVYQWFYSTGDFQFTSGFTDFDFTLTTNYILKRKAYKVFHTSFEEDGQPNAKARSGSKVWAGTYSLSLPGDNGNYKLSYWKSSSSGPWTLVEQTINVTSGTVQQLLIGDSNSIIDEVRLFPTGAEMTTYTYQPLVGVTSSTDPNNVTTYYEYDSFNRLSIIRDSDKNIIKTLDYNYQIK